MGPYGSISPNKASVRSAAISVGGESVTITQSGTFVADFNQDRIPDVIFGPDQWVGSGLYLGGPKGITMTNAANLTLQNKWRIVGVADFNRIAGHPLAGYGWCRYGPAWSMGGSNGNQITNAVNIIPDTPTRVVAVADFDLDGHPDLALQDPRRPVRRPSRSLEVCQGLRLELPD